LTDVFTVSCLNWRNCIGTQTGLSYAYMAAPEGTTATMPLYRGSSNTVELRLPAGDSDDEFRNQVTVTVSDGIGEEEAYIFPVTVSNISVCLIMGGRQSSSVRSVSQHYRFNIRANTFQ